MIFLRQYLRQLAAVLWTFLMVALRVASKSVVVISPTWERGLRRALFRTWSKVVIRIIGMRVEIRGTPPTPPFLLVSNHLTALDVGLLASQLGCIFVARQDLAQWPLLGFMAKNTDTIFIDRHRMRDTLRVNERIRKRLSEGYGIAIFAESRVSQDGKVHDFKPALLQPAASMNLPVHYASIHYATPEGAPPATEVIVWKEVYSFRQHLTNLTRLPYFTATLTFGDGPLIAKDRKVLAEELCAAVRAQFTALD